MTPGLQAILLSYPLNPVQGEDPTPDPSTISDTPPLPGPHEPLNPVLPPDMAAQLEASRVHQAATQDVSVGEYTSPSYDTGEPDVLPPESPAPAPLLNLGSRFPPILP